MPILDHFGLSEYPFQLSPSPGMFFTEGEHHAVLLSILFSLERGDGLIKVTGEVGTGKTTICSMVGRVLQERANVCWLSAPGSEPQHLAMAVAHGFGLMVGEADDAHATLRQWLNNQLAQGRRNILLVDEAQALRPAGLEMIRLLGSLDGGAGQLLQIVLFGQPELDRLLNRRGLRQVAQRINFGFVLKPLPKGLIAPYVRHRIENARKGRRDDTDLFTHRAHRAIAKISRGLPRLVNLLADKAMLAAYAAEVRIIDRSHILMAMQEVRANGTTLPFRYRYNWHRMVLLTLMGILSFGSGVAAVWAFGQHLS